MGYARAIELAFIGCAALGVYGFVTAAKDGETRRACTSLCALAPGVRRTQPHRAGFRAAVDQRRQSEIVELPRQGRDLELLDQDLPALSGRDAVDRRPGEGAESSSERRARHRHDRRKRRRRAATP